MDLHTNYAVANIDDEFQRWVLPAVNSMMLDILAATARKGLYRHKAQTGLWSAKS